MVSKVTDNAKQDRRNYV